jgi:hypothetical protein
MKELMISKELVCVVLNIPKESITDIYTDGNYLLIRKINSRVEEHNIYEFAFKCKEWARDKYDITISSSLYKNYAKSWNIDKDKSYTAKTEVEVIIKACNGILEQNK